VEHCWSEDVGKELEFTKDILSKLNSCPARVLEEVLERRVEHMIRLSPCNYTDYGYRVDFNTRSLSVLHENGQTWTKVPFVTDQVVDILFNYEEDEEEKDIWTELATFPPQKFTELYNYEMKEDTRKQLGSLSSQEYELLGKFELEDDIDKQACRRGRSCL
jgi:hypothetical protein